MEEALMSDTWLRETELLEGYNPAEKQQEQPIELEDLNGSNNNMQQIDAVNAANKEGQEESRLLDSPSLVRRQFVM